MPLQAHLEQGTIVICDFQGMIAPEMNKKRPVVIISPRLRKRQRLCTIVPLSTTEPSPIEAFHHRLHIDPPLPAPYNAKLCWVKADMIYTVSFDRLFFPFINKNGEGKRQYDIRIIDKSDLVMIQRCILHGIGMTALTDFL